MTDSFTEAHPFVTYLEGLREDRGALAALRRGLGRPPGRVPDMFPYVVPWLGKNPTPWYEAACYILASLFAMYPESARKGNMGAHLAAARASSPASEVAIERRFVALLKAHPDDLPVFLRHAISYLRAAGVKVNWHQLMRDLAGWGHPDRYVQRRWANAFWEMPAPREDEAPEGVEDFETD